jgi:CSLREA domain-containing protein
MNNLHLRRSSVALALTGIFFAVLTPLSAHAASYTVTTEDDEADGSPTCETGSSTDCSLREAIILANSGGADTIIIPAGTYNLTVTGSDDTAAAGDLDFTDTDLTTITGAGSGSVTIDATAISDRIFDARSGSRVDITGVTIQNGAQTSGAVGAGFYMISATVDLDDVVVQDNVITGTDSESSSQGAGMFVSGTTLTMTDSVIASNGDADEYVDGGGVYISGNSNVDFDRVTIRSNSVRERGGGIFTGASASTSKSFTDVTITDNIANNGGGFFLGGGTGYNAIDIRNTYFSGNHAEGAGGAVVSLGLLHLTNVTIYGNTADDDGGGLYVYNQNYVDVIAHFSTITGNAADEDASGGGDGGGVYVAGSDADLALKGTIIAGNTSPNSGDDCYADAGINTGNTYNLIGDTGSCTASWPGDTNVLNPAAVSYLATAISADNGGEVYTLAVSSDDITDVVPEEDCDDAASDPLTEDARGLTRPENSTCDMGAYEQDQTDPTVAVTSGTDTIECAGSWTDAGATVSDNFPEIFAATASGSVDENAVGSYTITYSTEDNDGNTGSNTRSVTVEDTTAPTVSVTGDDATVDVGDSYTDAGATATDACDGNVTVTTTGSVDTENVGSYTLTYTATDDEENTSTATRSVTVVAADDAEPVVTVRTNGKFVRVFEDGERVHQKKIGKKKVKRKYRKMLTRNIYRNKPYRNVVVLRVGKKKAKVVVFRLTQNNRLRKKAVHTFEYAKRNRVRLQVKRTTKRIIAIVGRGENTQKQRYRLKRNGRMRAIQ